MYDKKYIGKLVKPKVFGWFIILNVNDGGPRATVNVLTFFGTKKVTVDFLTGS